MRAPADTSMNFTLQPDTKLVFPSVTVVNASAGSGKTHNLTRRLVQFLLSDVIRKNDLKNVLAITFTNNAVREMRERVINELKKVALGDTEAVSDILRILSMPREHAIQKAEELITHVFDHYSDFQVKTIDSFLTAVFRECAVDHGFQPDVRIAIGDYRLVDLAFDTFARELEQERRAHEMLEPLADLIQFSRKKESSYIWDPYDDLARHVKQLYSLFGAGMSQASGRPYRQEMEQCTRDIQERIASIDRLIVQAGCEPKKQYLSFRDTALKGQIIDVVGRARLSRPAKKPTAQSGRERYEAVSPMIDHECENVNELITQYTMFHARNFYQPYLRALEMLSRTLNDVKRREGTIFLDDINMILSHHLQEENIPDIYFKLGDTLYHYLIDEFQDTAPIQWTNLRPLIDNALAEGGSLFVVGDPKQSIYGFRGADWKIMKELERPHAFPSVQLHEVAHLEQNFRSAEHIVEFVKEVFHKTVAGTDYAGPAAAAGLTTYEQSVMPKNRGTGYVEVVTLQYNDEVLPEKDCLLSIIADVTTRQFRYRDIAVITPANDDVVRVSGWLNERDIPFISHSSLDIRKRKSVGEIVSLLRFLDSPVDDLSFATVVLGDLYEGWLQHGGHAVRRDHIVDTVLTARASQKPLYTTFRTIYPGLWSDCFAHLLKMVGFLPLYDLLVECYKGLRVFETRPLEEASLARLAEVIREFERSGGSSIKDFLEFTLDEGEASLWELDAPTDMDAVTVMTVHKSKGLGFPVTAVLLYDREERRENMFSIGRGGERELLRITKATAGRVPELGEIYEEQIRRDQVDELNSLYVALTRAEVELFVVGVRSAGDRPPLIFLPPGPYHRGMKSLREAVLHTTDGAMSRLYHHSAPVVADIARSDLHQSIETARGEYVHQLLSRVEYLTMPAAETVQAILEEIPVPHLDQALLDEAEQAVVGFLSDQAIAYLFQAAEGRTVLVEQEAVDAGGRLFRMDRIMFDADTITVVDYKTGSMNDTAAHQTQVNTYKRLLVDMFPGRRIVGVIAFVDHRFLMNVE